jgi:DNA excision repair protein ERCC-4
MDVVVLSRYAYAGGRNADWSREPVPSLEELQPHYVILYDPWLAAVRQLETFNALQAKACRDAGRVRRFRGVGRSAPEPAAHGSAAAGAAPLATGPGERSADAGASAATRPAAGGSSSADGRAKRAAHDGAVRELAQTNALRAFFMFYEDSMEEQAYLTGLRAERDAFIRLIKEKAELVMPSAAELRAAMAPGAGTATARSTAVSTRVGGGARAAAALSGRIVVDTREFRSQLPARLYESGVDIRPLTIDVGDYVLTPECCVERKSVSDLFGSFGSGRLHTQATSMSRHYAMPSLLIEFEAGKPFSLQPRDQIPSHIKVSNIVSKIVLLTRHFPRLRLFWSRGPHHTIEVFKMLKENREEPDEAKAASLRAHEESSREHGEEGAKALTALDLLRSMPGVTAAGVRKLRAQAKTIAGLTAMDEDEIAAALGNKKSDKANARKLHGFLNNDIT